MIYSASKEYSFGGLCLSRLVAKEYKKEKTLEKIAIVVLQTNAAELYLADIVKNKSYVPYKCIHMPIDLYKDIPTEELINPMVVREVVDILVHFKNILDGQNITEVVALSDEFVRYAKNSNGFLNEIYAKTGFEFKVLTSADKGNYAYTSVINTFNRPKGVVINIGTTSTEIVHYNRRNVLDTFYLPFGSKSVLNDFADLADTQGIASKIEEKVATAMKECSFIGNLEEEYDVVCTGQTFRDLGVVSRKARKYPLEVEHNYEMTKGDLEKVYTALTAVGFSKSAKVKGVSVENSSILYSGACIARAIIKACNKDTFAISKFGVMDGYVLNYALPVTLEKPMTDNLGYSLQVLSDYYNIQPNNTAQVYNLSMIIFKQLKVLHKLPRTYVRVLRCASLLYNSGRRMNSLDIARNSFNVILGSDIYGLTHTELVLAAFTAQLVEPDNFVMSDWIKYKDLLTDDDLVAVKKLAVILKISMALDITSFGRIKDITCDVLGDSVIIKTITDGDVDISLELKYAKLFANDFKKAFQKSLEIL